MKSYRIITFGCQMNKYDSEKIAGILENMGYLPAAVVDDADIVILNTCCVRASADNKAIGRANAVSNLKNKKIGMLIGFGGCLAQKEGQDIFKKAKGIDFAFGPRSIDTIPDLISEAEKGNRRIFAFDEAETVAYKSPQIVRQNNISAWVAISAGCSNYCTYCIVPHVRGAESSRAPVDIIEEVTKLAQEGYREVTLLGQNVNTYGADLEDPHTLAQLIESLDSIDGIQRIRFTTSHPKDFDRRLLDIVADCDKVCEYFHLPMQAGSDRILNIMNRGYNREHYFHVIDQIRERIPGAAISSDFIVGFPGETDEDFAETIDAVERVCYDQAFTFLYSSRDGTPAASMSDQIEADIKSERFRILADVINDICLLKNRDLIGKKVQVMHEGIGKKDNDLFTGRTRSNKIVHYSSQRIIEPGAHVDVIIEDALSTYLRGREVDV